MDCDLQLRYPTALDLPLRQRPAESCSAASPEGAGDGRSPLGQEGGVSIDRSVFRRLRPRPRGKDEAPSPPSPPVAPRPAPRGEAEGDKLQEPRGLAETEGGDLWAKRRMLDEWARRLEQEQEASFDPRQSAGGLSRSSSAPMVGGRPRTAPAPYTAVAPPPTSTPPRRGQDPASSSMGNSWLSTPPKPRAPKTDRVSRGAQVRDLWKSDRFLRATGDRKFDLRGCGSPAAGQVPLRRTGSASQLLIPTYVPPHEKRRDDVRQQVREQMRAPDYF